VRQIRVVRGKLAEFQNKVKQIDKHEVIRDLQIKTVTTLLHRAWRNDMTQHTKQQIFKQLCDAIGINSILAALPQQSVKDALKLTTMKELADTLGVKYETLRSQVASGKIPHPEMQLRRRAYYTQSQVKRISAALHGD